MKTAESTVLAMWEAFRVVIPVDSPREQHIEMRRAFYAGAWAMLWGMHALGADDVPEDAGCDWLEARRAEMEQFQRDVLAGRS